MKIIIQMWLNRSLMFFLLCLTSSNHIYSQKLIEVQKISNSDYSHNAFSSFIFYKGVYYCAYRGAKEHHTYDGVIVLMMSKDKKQWNKIREFEIKGQDLRDPKLKISGDGRLAIFAVSRFLDKKGVSKHLSYVWTSMNGEKWSEPFTDFKNTWRWDVVKGEDLMYSVAYSGVDKKGTLYKTKNLKDWSVYVDEFFPYDNTRPNETALFMREDKVMVAVVRQDKGSKKTLVGISDFPYKRWTWSFINENIAGPGGVLINDNKLLLCGRVRKKQLRTVLYEVTLFPFSYKELLVLPSRSDTGYCSVYRDPSDSHIYYISYHSTSFMKNTDVYLAKIYY
ncbi:hypothetical protein PG275_01040 [Riemerella anatipestifer]|uniref:hypothetical protein n=1 Tax=Riemerella anatipestifer TaxID=34085 RepID=UPI002A8B00B3|nr:hypothetical protein [Riemerella anatipestifer]